MVAIGQPALSVIQTKFLNPRARFARDVHGTRKNHANKVWILKALLKVTGIGYKDRKKI